jgi:hypothetical protein
MAKFLYPSIAKLDILSRKKEKWCQAQFHENTGIGNFQPDTIFSGSYFPEGGRVFGGGGFFIPSRNSSPVVLRFQFTDILWLVG